MEKPIEFLNSIIDSIPQHVVVIDAGGDIQFVNKRWSTFGNDNACETTNDWLSLNYISECDKAAARGSDDGAKVGEGIRNVINNRVPLFHFEYPCHSPQERRWFMVQVVPFHVDKKKYFVISHQNITTGKVAEEEAMNIARIDGLTGVPNRRAFDEFFSSEWKRCIRQKRILSLAMVDIDFFKLFNDTYGHQAGDECLVKVSHVLKEFCHRPGDIFARYGGEEFVLVWGNTSLKTARELANKLLGRIVELKIEHKKSPNIKYLTASIGLATTIPGKGSQANDLIGKADRLLYQAKEKGKNRVES